MFQTNLTDCTNHDALYMTKKICTEFHPEVIKYSQPQTMHPAFSSNNLFFLYLSTLILQKAPLTILQTERKKKSYED